MTSRVFASNQGVDVRLKGAEHGEKLFEIQEAILFDSSGLQPDLDTRYSHGGLPEDGRVGAFL